MNRLLKLALKLADGLEMALQHIGMDCCKIIFMPLELPCSCHDEIGYGQLISKVQDKKGSKGVTCPLSTALGLGNFTARQSSKFTRFQLVLNHKKLTHGPNKTIQRSMYPQWWTERSPRDQMGQ